VTLDQFELCGDVVAGVLDRLGEYVEDEESADKVEPFEERRKVTFGEVVDLAIDRHGVPEKVKS
jgi:hypothetical protein